MNQFDRQDYLKTRHFISLDQVNAEQKIASLKKEKPFSIGGQKLKIFLRRLFK